MAECGATSEFFGMTLVCEKPLGHEGMHGAGPETIYTTEWPESPPSD